MSRSDELRLTDIVDACRELAVVVSVDRATFLADPIRIRAAERLLEIIGEAANGLSTAARDAHAGVNWRDVTRLRIVLAHHYQRVDPNQVWSMAAVEVPALLARLEPEQPEP